jgi:hypothetical protein
MSPFCMFHLPQAIETGCSSEYYVNNTGLVRFEVSTAMTMMIIIFWEMWGGGWCEEGGVGGGVGLRRGGGRGGAG